MNKKTTAYILALMMVFTSAFGVYIVKAEEGNENKMYPIEDTYVSSWLGAENARVNGLTINLRAGYTTLPSAATNSYDGVSLDTFILIKFDISQVKEKINSATLHLTCQVGNVANLTFLEVGSDEWDDKTTNYQIKPSLRGNVIATKTLEVSTDYLTDVTGVDITEYLNRCVENGQGQMSIAITNSGGGNHLKMTSMEVGFIDDEMMPFIKIRSDKNYNFSLPEYKYDSIYKPTPIKPIEGHPRVCITKETIPLFREKFFSEEATHSREAIYGASENPNGKLTYGVSNAILYIATGDKTYGKKAVDIAWEVINKKLVYGKLYDYYNAVPQNLVNISLIFDWCYDLIDLEQRKEFARLLKVNAVISESGYPPVGGGAVVGHMPGPILRGFMTTGIAIYDEDPEFYEWAAGRCFDEIFPALNWFNQANGLSSQGMGSYGQIRDLMALYSTYLYNGMGYHDIINDGQGDLYYSSIYSRLPSGRVIRTDDNGEWYNDYTFTGKQESPSTGQDIIAPMLIGLTHNPYYRDEWLREFPTVGTFAKMWSFVYDDYSVKSKSITSLPLTRYFGRPLGMMVARTGWDEDINLQSDTVVAMMNMSEYNPGNHKHIDAGNFQLYYRGNMAVEDGEYYNYQSSHHKNYYHKTIAHNCMLIYDPNEVFLEGVNDGGQRFIGEASTLDNVIEDDNYHTADIIYADYGPDAMKPEYTYFKANLAPAYTDKVKQYERSFMFINMKESEYPAAIVVFDRVTSSDCEFKKTYLLHTIDEPQVEKNRSTITLSEDNYTGKMINDTLLPEVKNTVISKMQGYDVNGIKYAGKKDEGTHWRLEISPKKIQETDLFLNVMQVEEGSLEPLPVKKIEDDTMVGVEINDRIILFSKTGNQISKEYTMQYGEQSEDVTYLFGDIKSGEWEINNNGVLSTQKVMDEKGVIYVEGKGGEITIRPIKNEEVKIAQFMDISSHWAKSFVDILNQDHILNADETMFKPNEAITMETLLNWTFDAVNIDKGENYINTAYDMELLDATIYPKEEFDHQKEVSREELAMVIARAFNRVTSHYPYVDTALDAFEDKDEISNWNNWNVAVAVRKGIMTGTTNVTFSPKGKVTRAQAAQTIANLKKVTEAYLFNKLEAKVDPWNKDTIQEDAQ